MNDPHTDGRRDAVDLIAKRGFRYDGQDSAGTVSAGRAGHGPTVPGHHAAPPAADADLWTKPDVWTARGMHPAKSAGAGKTHPTKGTTPARGGGGEGRRESAPGGRADTPSAKPSTAYYTHDSIARRKSCLKFAGIGFRTLCLDLRSSRATESWLTGCFAGHLAVCLSVPLCWGGDRLGLGR
jgi:hypothetical protein